MDTNDEINWTPDDTWARAAVRNVVRLALARWAAEIAALVKGIE